MSSRVSLTINALCAVLLGWLYGGDALDVLRSRSAEVSAYLEPPNLAFALAALAATAVGFGATVLGTVRARPPAWRGYRLMPIVAVVGLFVDLFVLTGAKSPLTSADRTALTLRSFVEAANAAATVAQVPKDPQQLQTLLEPFGPPAYRVKGEPAKRWAVALREGCTGPVVERKAEPLGTLFYCLAADGKTAWVSVVALPVGTYFGDPALFTRGGELISGVVNAAVAEDPSEAPPQVAPEPELEPDVLDSGR